MWYVVRTETGREEQIVEEIRALLPQDKYKECFSMKRENLCHSRGELKVIVERMFPGYVFLVTDAPAYFYDELKRIPRYAKVLGREEDEFFPIREEEQKFLQSLMDEGGGHDKEKCAHNGKAGGHNEEKCDHLVKLSPVITDKNGDLVQVGGVLRQYRKNIVKKRNRLRYVLVKMELFGREREIYLGIRMEGDLGESREEFLKEFQQDFQTGSRTESGVQAENGIQTERDVQIESGGKSAIRREDVKKILAARGICEGASVCVMSGSLAGSVGRVTDINPARGIVTIETDFFNRKQKFQLDWKTGIKVVESR